MTIRYEVVAIYIYIYIYICRHETNCLIGRSCRIHQQLLCRGIRAPNECPVYDTKQPDVEIPVILEFGGMWSNPSLPSLPGPLWLRVTTLVRVLSMGQIELNGIHMLNWIVGNRTVLHWICVLMLKWIIWNRTVLKFHWTVLIFYCF